MRLINFSLLVHVIAINAAVRYQYPDTAWGHLGDNRGVQLFSPQHAGIDGRAKFGNEKFQQIGTIRDVAQSENDKPESHLKQQIWSERPKQQGDINPSETHNQQHRYVSNDGFNPASQAKTQQDELVSTGNINCVNSRSNFHQLQQPGRNEMFAQGRRLHTRGYRQRRGRFPHGRRRRRLRRRVKHHNLTKGLHVHDGEQNDSEEDSEEWTSSEELPCDEEDFPVGLKHEKNKAEGGGNKNDSSESNTSDSSEEQKETGRRNRKIEGTRKGKGKRNRKSKGRITQSKKKRRRGKTQRMFTLNG